MFQVYDLGDGDVWRVTGIGQGHQDCYWGSVAQVLREMSAPEWFVERLAGMDEPTDNYFST